MNLPKGYRFAPTDEELISHYLTRKNDGCSEDHNVIAEIDVCKFEPWDLPEQSAIKSKDRKWWFFSPRNRKYPSGRQSHRSTAAGYWKATGNDRVIKSTNGGSPIGSKKTLVFYEGRSPDAKKTRWIMHEYHSSSKNPGSYVLCYLYDQLDEKIPDENSNAAGGHGSSHPLTGPSNLPNHQLGTQEGHVPLACEVDSKGSNLSMPEGSNLTSEDLATMFSMYDANDMAPPITGNSSPETDLDKFADSLISSSGSTNQDEATGIESRPHQTREPTPDLSRQSQGTAPRRIRLMKSSAMQDKSPKDEGCGSIQNSRSILPMFLLFLAVLVVVIFYAVWKRFTG